MDKADPKRSWSFQAKVLATVLAAMALLLALTLVSVHRLVTRRLHDSAVLALSTAKNVFHHSLVLRSRGLSLQFGNITKEPRFKAMAKLADSGTSRSFLADFLEEVPGVEVILFSTDKRELLAGARRHMQVNLAELHSVCLPAVTQALEGQASEDIVQYRDRLYDIVSVPVIVDEILVGALTFGVEIGASDAQELRLLTGAEVVFIAGDRVAASTLNDPLSAGQLVGLFNQSQRTPAAATVPQTALLQDEPFLWLPGKFTTLSGNNPFGYLLLSSYEKPLRELKATQNWLWLVGLSGIGLSSVVAWALIGRTYADRIIKNAQRCHKIVQSLLSFARQHPPERKPTQLNDLIEATIELLIYELRTSNIEVVKSFQPDLPKLMVDPHQLQQVILNILNNARQALEGRPNGGRIEIHSEAVSPWVRLTFKDNGPGISKEHLEKIFQPFFTTKRVGIGTGLGLSLSYGIVQEHGGTILAQSSPGEGATFTIELPLQLGAVPEPHAAAAPPHQPESGIGRRLLVIDDEDTILELLRESLGLSGYTVDCARDGEAALAKLRTNAYDLALCDWKMPGLGGQQLYERLLESSPSAARRLIFMTGDVLSEKTQRFLQEHGKVCLSKPFRLDDFQQAVADALDEQARNPGLSQQRRP